MLKWYQDINYVKILPLNCCRSVKWHNECNRGQLL